MLRMDIRTFTHYKNFFSLFILLLTISCSTVTVESTYSKGNSPIQKSQIIEGKFKKVKKIGYWMLAPVFLKNLISSKIFKKNDSDKNTIVTVIIFFKYE